MRIRPNEYWLWVVAFLLIPVGMASKSAEASVTGFPQDLAGFNAATGNAPMVIDFDSIANNTNITGETISGVAFEAPGAALVVVQGLDTCTPGETSPCPHRLVPTTGANCLSPGGASLACGNPGVENDDLRLIFDPPVSAFGLDLLEQSINGGDFILIRVFDASDVEMYSEVILTPPGSNAPGASHFYGIVSSEQDIARVEFDESDTDCANPDANIGYDSFRIATTLPAPRWALRSTTGPTPRFVHGLVSDSCRNVVVAYGGTIDNSGQTFNDTWEWDGQAWIQKTTTGSVERRQFGTAFDSCRCRAVLFGGNDAVGGYFGETWEYDGNTSTWERRLPATSPSARSGPALAFDDLRCEIVLFGGYQPGHTNDTWTWDGSNWSPLATTTPPSPRTNVGMAYDAERDRLVVFGGTSTGSCGGPFLDQTWELDRTTSPATWTQITTTSKPSPRQPVRLVYDPVRARTILFGGNLGCVVDSDETWEYDGMVPSWTLVPTNMHPSARQGHDMAYDEARHEIVLFGGRNNDGSLSGETWSYGHRSSMIPTLSQWGVIAMATGLLCAGGRLAMRRRTPV